MPAPDQQPLTGEGLIELTTFIADRIVDFAKLTQRRDLSDAMTGDALAVIVKQIVQRTVTYVRRSRGWS
jgi:hypothetical protein